MRMFALLLGLGLASAGQGTNLLVLVVDGERLENGLSVYAELDRQLEQARALADLKLRQQRALALELHRSEILTAIPELIHEIAEGEQADVVLDVAAARRIGLSSARDITAQVEALVLQRFGAFDPERP